MLKMKKVQLKFRYYIDLPDGGRRLHDSNTTETVEATDYMNLLNHIDRVLDTKLGRTPNRVQLQLELYPNKYSIKNQDDFETYMTRKCILYVTITDIVHPGMGSEMTHELLLQTLSGLNTRLKTLEQCYV